MVRTRGCPLSLNRSRKVVVWRLKFVSESIPESRLIICASPSHRIRRELDANPGGRQGQEGLAKSLRERQDRWHESSKGEPAAESLHAAECLHALRILLRACHRPDAL